MDNTLNIIFLIVLPIVAGLLIAGVSLHSIWRTQRAILPFTGMVCGVVLIYAPQVLTDWWGVPLTETVKNVLSYQFLIACIIVSAGYVLLVVDIIATLNGHPLAHHNINRADANALETARTRELWANVVALLALTSVLVAGYVYLTRPNSILVGVYQAARNNSEIRVRFNPFIAEIDNDPGHDFNDLIAEAEALASTEAQPNVKIARIRKIRFVARDNRLINEVVFLFDGYYDLAGAPGRSAVAVTTEEGTVNLIAVPKDKEPIDNRTISLFLTPNSEETEEYAQKLIDKYQSSDLRSSAHPFHRQTLEHIDFDLNPVSKE